MFVECEFFTDWGGFFMQLHMRLKRDLDTHTPDDNAGETTAKTSSEESDDGSDSDIGEDEEHSQASSSDKTVRRRRGRASRSSYPKGRKPIKGLKVVIPLQEYVLECVHHYLVG